MKDKAIMLTVIVAILLVGVIAIAGLTMVYTGQPIRERYYCECSLERFDFYGNPIGAETHPLRDVYPQAHQHEMCNELCLQKYEPDGKTRVSGKVELFKFRRPRPYHEPRAFPSRI